jgi:hypothetical protein
MAQDRLEDDHLPLTHEFLGLMLGTHRSPVMPSRPMIPTSILGLLVPLADHAALRAFIHDSGDYDRARHDHRRKAGFDEIYMLDAPLAGFQWFAHRKINGFQVRFEQRKILAREA